MADISKIKRAISQCKDISDLRQLKRHINQRIDVVNRKNWQDKIAAEWLILKSCNPDDILYCCAEGHFLGGNIQRGDALKVSYIQPRAKRVWFYGEDGKPHKYYMDAATATRYQLRKNAPENPISERERKFAAKAGEAIQNALR